MSYMNDLKLSKFMYETIACGAFNQLPISSVCNGKCLFCSNEMNPFPIHREGFRPMDDVKKGISHLNGEGEIRMGDSLPGRISEGEALLHPEILEILRLVRDKCPNNVIQISTNGVTLSKEFIEKLVPFKPMKFTVSYHSDNPEHWSRIFNLPESRHKTARAAFFHLLKNEFLIEGAIVPLPNLVGYDDIENTIKSLRIFTKKVIVYLPGYSKKAAPKLKKMLNTDYTEISRFMMKMRKKYRLSLDLATDLLMPVPFYPEPVMRGTFQKNYKNVLWIFSEAAYEKTSKILNDLNPFMPNEHHSFMAKNHTYGGNIICSGLLMVADYRKAIAKALKEFDKKGVKIDAIIIPANSFDKYGDDLTGENHSKLKEEFGLPVWVTN
jgi:uncharacterized Fe-S cluster-containing radical SAM superfamily protein